MTPLRTSLLILAVVGAFGLTACGGSDSPDVTSEQSADIQAITDLGDQLTDAIKRNEPAEACAMLDPAMLKQEFDGKKGCEKQLQVAINTQKKAPEFQIDQVTVDGDYATAKGPTTNLYLHQIDGKWYVGEQTPQSPELESESE